MASSRATVDFIRDQMQAAGVIAVRPMSGEFGLYLDGKMIAMVCDDTLFFKDTFSARALVESPQLAAPYPGAKPHLVGDALLDEPEKLIALAHAVWKDTPVPAPKKPRKPKA